MSRSDPACADLARSDRPIPTIGLLGGVASGKSAVAACFERCGCCVLDGDIYGHRVLEEPEVIQAAIQRWGSAVEAEGRLNRREIARRVFCNEPECGEALRFWESVTHPRIGKRMAADIARLRKENEFAGIVLDAAVMVKASWQKQCDFLVFVDAPYALRLARAEARGWTAEQLQRREAAQTSLDEKRRLADFVIDNSADLEQTYEQVVKVWHSLSR